MIEPGIHENLSMEAYLALPFLNSSTLKYARQSLAHVKAAMDGRLEREPTQFTIFGALCHTLYLEPHAEGKRYAVDPGPEAFRTKDGKLPAKHTSTAGYKEWAAKKADAGMTVISKLDMARARAVCAAIQADEDAQRYLVGVGRRELTLVWDDLETGLRCKARVDFEGEYLTDLKTGIDVAEFEKTIANRGWHYQAAHIRRGYQTLTGESRDVALVAAETDEPFCVRAAPLDLGAVDRADQQIQRWLEAIQRCQLADHWPGYGSPDFWALPDWAA